MILRDDTTLRDDLNALTPRLRRYARALTTGHAAASDLADDLVHATLMRALGARNIGLPADLIIRLYATVTQLNREVALSSQQARAAGVGAPALVAANRTFSGPRPTRLSSGLLTLPLEAREALLLVGLEGFDYAEAARILRISRSVLIGRLTQARTALDAALRMGPALARGPATQAGIAQASAARAGAGQSGASAAHATSGRSRPPYLRLVT